jgi:hypothetical protein
MEYTTLLYWTILNLICCIFLVKFINILERINNLEKITKYYEKVLINQNISIQETFEIVDEIRDNYKSIFKYTETKYL